MEYKIKDIQGFEGLYAITTDGHIWSYPKPNPNGYGSNHYGKWLIRTKYGKNNYLRMTLFNPETDYRLTTTIHRIVALTFIPNPYELPQVNHKNGIKWDNRVENLEWVNNTLNMQHAIKTGLYNLKGTSHPNSKLTDKKVRMIRSVYEGHRLHAKDFKSFPKYKVIANKLGVSSTLVGAVVRRKIWTHI